MGFFETLTPAQQRAALAYRGEDSNMPTINPVMGRARNARISQAKKHCTELLDALQNLSGFPKTDHVDLKDEWWGARNSLEQLVQCFHEANAYNNATAPQGGEAQSAQPTEREKPRSVPDEISAGEEPARGS